MIRFLSACSPSRLRRVTSGENYVPEIDGVRFVAIVCVLIQHLHERILRRTAAIYPDIPEHLFHTAGAGVSIFFALSGLILYRGLANSLERHGAVNLKSYFWRRITRLEPPYVIVMTALFLYLSVVGYNSAHIRRFNTGPDSLFVAYLASLSYTYCMIFGSLPKLNGVAWSLEIEVQYYVMAPLLAILIRGSGLKHRAILFFLMALLWAGVVTPLAFGNLHTRYTLLTSLPYFLLGMAIEEVCRASAGSYISKLPGWVADLVGLLAFIALATFQLPIESAQSSFVKAILVFLALWGMLHGKVWRKFLSLSWVSLIGGMCYSIYLIHMPILEVGANLTSKIGAGVPYPLYLLIQGGLLLTAVLAVSMCFYAMIERPCMNKNWPGDLAARLRHWRGKPTRTDSPQNT
jgi:peptidoglycan/LPS O-acetylase OafA/YrhL